MVLAFTVTGTTAVVVTMTNNADTLYAAPWTNPATGLVYLGLWNETTSFPLDAPKWNSILPAPGTLASAITSISVTALAGNDFVHLNFVDDATTFSALANTSISGGDGTDYLVGTFTPDDIDGGTENDTLYGMAGNDDINGDDHDDTIYGGAGLDSLYGGLHNDTIKGETDNDIIEGNEGNDTLDGGWGSDFVEGNADVDTIDGGVGTDFLYGGTENDTIKGGDGDDTIEGNEHNDTIWGGGDGDEIRGNAGDDTIHGEGGIDTIYGGADNDRIFGGTDGDFLYGEAGDDWIEGGADNDLISGGNDKDILWSNAGTFDQPWDGVGETAGWADMKGTGPAGDGACDVEDNHPECTNTGPTPIGESYAVSHASPPGVFQVAAPGVLGNDWSIPGNNSPLKVTYVSPPSHSTYFTLFDDGHFTYTPEYTFVGTDYFYYKVSQLNNEIWVESKKLGIVTINVTNIPPFANGESVFTMKNVPASLNVLTNDLVGDGDNLDISVITQAPTHGTLTTNFQTGVVTYTPTTGYIGTDSFSYKVTDGFAESPTAATVGIIVGGFLRLDGDSISNSSPTVGFNLDDVESLERAAVRHWGDGGADVDDVRTRLAGISIQVLDLPGDALAFSAPGILVIDINGAGHDWFVDRSPLSDKEFASFTAKNERRALAGSNAYGRVDLLTVLMHETGHSLGLDHSDDRHNVMAARLPTGTRRFPTAEDVDLAILNGLGDEFDRHRRRR